jgi:protein-L-isoaspartate(D-aspartate) O-methyltransferase
MPHSIPCRVRDGTPEAMTKGIMVAPTPILGFVSSRRRMLEMQLRARGIADSRVIGAIIGVPRELFAAPSSAVVDAGDLGMLLEAAELRFGDRVLEVGGGAGYAAAVISLLAGRVIALEPDATRADDAREKLGALGYARIDVRAGNHAFGCFEHAPYDAIVVSTPTAAISPALLAQLAVGGRLVLPQPDGHGVQLVRVTRTDESTFHTSAREWSGGLERLAG